MPNDDIDLTGGEPQDDVAARRRQRRKERAASGGSKSSSASTEESFTEREVREGLGRAFEGIAKGRAARGDEELAGAIVEEGDAMTEGFVTLTNNVTALRLPLIIALNVVIVFGAFGRVGGILWGRFTTWRAQRQAAYEQTTTQENGVTIIEE